ncbi:enamine deaminase RidA (YjgF/YER057c/UK114 family) [Bradyrhizobium sp. S3.9.1]
MIKRYVVGSRMSQAVAAGGMVHIAGQVADDRKAGIVSQTQQVLAKIDALLKEAGSDRSKLIAVNVFLPHITDLTRRRAPASKPASPIPTCASR